MSSCFSLFSFIRRTCASALRAYRATVYYAPGDDYEEVQSVPAVRQVGALADEAHGEHLDEHLDGEVGVDSAVSGLEH